MKLARRIGEDKVRAILLARAQGESLRAIARANGVATQTALEVCKEHKPLLQKLQAAYFEELYSSIGLVWAERLRRKAELLRRVDDELAQRDLADVPTDKLAAMQLKLEESASAMLVQPDFEDSPDERGWPASVPEADWRLVDEADEAGTEA